MCFTLLLVFVCCLTLTDLSSVSVVKHMYIRRLSTQRRAATHRNNDSQSFVSLLIGLWVKCSTRMCTLMGASAWTSFRTAGPRHTTCPPSSPQSSPSWTSPTPTLQQTAWPLSFIRLVQTDKTPCGGWQWISVAGKQTRIREEGGVCGGAELVDILRGGGREGGREQGRGCGVRGRGTWRRAWWGRDLRSEEEREEWTCQNFNQVFHGYVVKYIVDYFMEDVLQELCDL